MPDDSSAPYRVVYSEHIRTALKEYLRLAKTGGVWQTAVETIKTIDRALSQSPLEFGDPWYRLPKARLQIMARLLPPWFVVYGVHLQEPIVFIKDVQLYPKWALD